MEATSLDYPIDLSLDGQGRFVLNAWAPGWAGSRTLRSRVPNRRFSLRMALAGDVGASSQVLSFDVANPTRALRIRPSANHSSPIREYLSGILTPSKSLTGTLHVETTLDSGQTLGPKATFRSLSFSNQCG